MRFWISEKLETGIKKSDLWVMDYLKFLIEFRPLLYALEFPIREGKPGLNRCQLAFSPSAIAVLKQVAEHFKANHQTANLTIEPMLEGVFEVRLDLSVDDFPVAKLVGDKQNRYNLTRAKERKIRSMKLKLAATRQVANRQKVLDQLLFGSEMSLNCVGYDPIWLQYLADCSSVDLPAVVLPAGKESKTNNNDLSFVTITAHA